MIPILGPSGHCPHSNHRAHHSVVFVPRAATLCQHSAGKESVLSHFVKARDMKAGKKTPSLQCASEVDLKRIQSSDTSKQIGLRHHETILISKNNLVFYKVS